MASVPENGNWTDSVVYDHIYDKQDSFKEHHHFHLFFIPPYGTIGEGTHLSYRRTEIRGMSPFDAKALI